MATIGGFTAGPDRASLGVRSFVVPGTGGVVLPVRAEIAPLLVGLAAEYHLLVEPLVTGWNWGYAFRAVRGAASLSYHAGGLAIYLNAPRHPLGKRGTHSPAQAATCRALATKYGLRWGGSYTGRVDAMHFEVIVGRPAALALVARLQAPAVPRPAAPNTTAAGPPHPALVVDGDFGPATRRALQVALNATGARPRLVIDGDYGPATQRALQARLNHTNGPVAIDGKAGIGTIQALQRHLGVRPQNGRFGPATTRALQQALNAGTF